LIYLKYIMKAINPQPNFFGVLFMIMCFLSWAVCNAQAESYYGLENKLDVESDTQAQAEREQITTAKPKLEYSAQGLRDPLVPLVFLEIEKPEQQIIIPGDTSSESLSGLTVQGIIWGGRVAQAIINNSVVKVGDTVQGAQIIEINKDGIVVSYGNREFIIPSPAITSYSQEPKGGKNETEF